MEDQPLVGRAQRGDKDAFAQLVEAYQTPVYNLAYRMLGDAKDAEDAAQETFLRAYAQLRKFHADQEFATWLLSICAHHCIDRLRRRRFRWLSLEDRALDDVLVSDDPEPDEELLRRESQQEIERLLERLSPASRLVVILHYWHEQSIGEIARTTGDSVGAVKVRLHRARQALGREMAVNSVIASRPERNEVESKEGAKQSPTTSETLAPHASAGVASARTTRLAMTEAAAREASHAE